tara:strand:+ start:1265 stop:2830 length:1566 start_codon:yes stop_codon:yes gene_type:complete
MLSKKEIVNEIVKSGKDPIYFVNNYAKISHPLKGLIPFKTYDFQDALLKDFNDYRYNVILKARQLGISTITAAYVSWMMLFHRDKNILVMATKFGTAANLVKKVKSIIKNLPPWIQIAKISTDNRTSFELSNGSQIKASSTSSDAGRSEALSLLIIDEAAHVEGLDELWTGLYPTLSTGGRCIALSTPNGVGNWFHKTYVEADQGKNDFKPTLLMWNKHPERDISWFEHETRNMSRRQIAQEFECNFNTSGDTVFHSDDIGRIFKGIREPKYKTGFDRNFWIWEQAQASFTYMISADVARGDGADYSVFHVFKLETMEIVAEYQGKLTPDLFSEVLYGAGKEYGGCMIVVENNTVGFAVLEKLKEKEYPNVYHSIKSTHEYIEEYLAENRAGAVPGFTTSSKTKPLIIAKMEEFVRNKLLTIYSSRIANEMKTFIWNRGKATAQRSYNDDLIMACAIGCWVRDTALVENKRDVEYTKAALNAIMVSNKTLHTSIDGMREHRKIKEQQKVKEHHDFIWMFKG